MRTASGGGNGFAFFARTRGAAPAGFDLDRPTGAGDALTGGRLALGSYSSSLWSLTSLSSTSSRSPWSSSASLSSASSSLSSSSLTSSRFEPLVPRDFDVVFFVVGAFFVPFLTASLPLPFEPLSSPFPSFPSFDEVASFRPDGTFATFSAGAFACFAAGTVFSLLAGLAISTITCAFGLGAGVSFASGVGACPLPVAVVDFCPAVFAVPVATVAVVVFVDVDASGVEACPLADARPAVLVVPGVAALACCPSPAGTCVLLPGKARLGRQGGLATIFVSHCSQCEEKSDSPRYAAVGTTNATVSFFSFAINVTPLHIIATKSSHSTSSNFLPAFL